MGPRVQAFSGGRGLIECYCTLYVLNPGILRPLEPQKKGRV